MTDPSQTPEPTPRFKNLEVTIGYDYYDADRDWMANLSESDKDQCRRDVQTRIACDETVYVNCGNRPILEAMLLDDDGPAIAAIEANRAEAAEVIHRIWESRGLTGRRLEAPDKGRCVCTYNCRTEIHATSIGCNLLSQNAEGEWTRREVEVPLGVDAQGQPRSVKVPLIAVITYDCVFTPPLEPICD